MLDYIDRETRIDVLPSEAFELETTSPNACLAAAWG